MIGLSQQLSVDIFDVRSKQSKRGATGAFRSWPYSAVGIHDQILVLIDDNGSATWWAYGTLSDKWKKGPTLPTFRSESCLVTLQNRYILLIGGRSPSYNCSKVVEYCEPGHAGVNNDDDEAFFRVATTADSTWIHRAPPLPEPRVDVSAAELNGRIFVVGGSTRWWHNIARTAVFTPQMGVDNGDGDDSSPRLGGQWFLLSPESSPSSLASSLVSHAGCIYFLGRDLYNYGAGFAQCFRPCSEEELENLRQEASKGCIDVEGAASEGEANSADESPLSEHTAASDNRESDETEEDNVITLPDSDALSTWRWRPFCAPDELARVSCAGVINVTIPSGRK